MAALRLAIPTIAVAALALVIPGAAPAKPTCRGAHKVPRAGHLKAARTATLCLLNRQRTHHGLQALHASRRLRLAATRHSLDMARGDYFAHDSRDGSSFVDRIRRTGYLTHSSGWGPGGENIAWGAGVLATPANTVRAWMHSEGHRRNILDRRFRQIGIGIVAGAPAHLSAGLAGATYTTDFGRRG